MEGVRVINNLVSMMNSLNQPSKHFSYFKYLILHLKHLFLSFFQIILKKTLLHAFLFLENESCY